MAKSDWEGGCRWNSLDSCSPPPPCSDPQAAESMPREVEVEVEVEVEGEVEVPAAESIAVVTSEGKCRPRLSGADCRVLHMCIQCTWV